MKYSTFGWSSFLEHLPRAAATCRGVLGLEVMTRGSGPIDEDVFDGFLERCGISASVSGSDTLVIGHRDWDPDDLANLLDDFAGGTLRVYSQEMVIASMAMGADVFDVMTPDELAEFGTGHRGLEFLSEDMRFAWPTTDVASSSDSVTVNFTGFNSPETGFLAYMGYHVGKTSKLTVAQRRAILDRVLGVDIHPASAADRAHADAWSTPMSAARLKKAANCIASFARLRKRNTLRDNTVAIADWEQDLDYLRSRYYDVLSSRFRWPDTRVT